MRRIVMVSDACDTNPPEPVRRAPADFAAAWGAARRLPPVPRAEVRVTGGPLERLPLAAVAHGLADRAEIWDFGGHDRPGGYDSRDHAEGGAAPAPRPDPERPGLARRRFRADAHPAPWGSEDAVAHLRAEGAPDILCLRGPGVTHDLLDAARGAVVVHLGPGGTGAALDPALAARLDILVAECDAEVPALRAAAPQALVPVMPIGPEFASDEAFRPLGLAPEFDLVHLAPAAPGHGHEALFAALRAGPGRRALCLLDGGPDGDRLRRAARGLAVTFEDAPEDPAARNAALNRARVALVAGPEARAPAVLTEAMLAGLPVLAAGATPCTAQFIRPGTGLAVAEEGIAAGLDDLLARAAGMDPRAEAQARWTWPHAIRRLAALVDEARARRGARAA